jgi:integrase/recombinase XerD
VFPDFLVPHLRTYIDVVRPRLLRNPSCSSFWASRNGGELSYDAIWFIVARHSRERLGLHLSPHDFRDAAATLWAIAMPAQIGVASDLLGHADPRTLKHYNLARGVEASRAYAKRIAEIRKANR